MLDGEPLIVGITIGSVEEAFKQAVQGPSPEDKEKVVHYPLHQFYIFFEVTLHHCFGRIACVNFRSSSTIIYVLIGNGIQKFLGG